MCVCLCECCYGRRSERPRRAAVVNYFADGVKSDTDEEVLNGVPVIKKVRINYFVLYVFSFSLTSLALSPSYS